jgi:hypothetical protein
MNSSPAGYDFTLTRGQRACSLLAEWWLALALVSFSLVVSARLLPEHWVFFVLICLSVPLVLRGFILGVRDLFSDGRVHVEIRENGVGCGRETADWWVFADGIRQIRRNPWGTTSIRHHNGAYIDIPSHLLRPDDLELLHKGLQKYHHPHKK